MPATLSLGVTANSEAAMAAAIGEDCSHVTIWDSVGVGRPPAGGNHRWTIALSNDPNALTLGAMIQFAANQIRYIQNEVAGETNYQSEAKLEGMINGGLWMQFHDAAPGANGTNNIMNLARAALAEADFSIVRS